MTLATSIPDCIMGYSPCKYHSRLWEKWREIGNLFGVFRKTMPFIFSLPFCPCEQYLPEVTEPTVPVLGQCRATDTVIELNLDIYGYKMK